MESPYGKLKGAAAGAGETLRTDHFAGKEKPAPAKGRSPADRAGMPLFKNTFQQDRVVIRMDELPVQGFKAFHPDVPGNNKPVNHIKLKIIITFAGEKVKSIMFWTLGSLQGSSYQNAALLYIALVICGANLLCRARELNAFAVGEDNARNVGVNVRRVKLTVLICVSVLIGVCVSVSGTIGFVGLVTPHMLRRLTGPNHKRLLPASMFGGAVFQLLADLLARTVLNPRELPIGVVTSFVGSIVFVYIFWRSRQR